MDISSLKPCDWVGALGLLLIGVGLGAIACDSTLKGAILGFLIAAGLVLVILAARLEDYGATVGASTYRTVSVSYHRGSTSDGQGDPIREDNDSQQQG